MSPTAGPWQSPPLRYLLEAVRYDLGFGASCESWNCSESEWLELISRAVQHGIAGSLYRCLDIVPAIPTHVEKVIRSTTRDQISRNLHLTGELFEILNVFSNENINVLVLKGPTISVLSYGQLVSRSFCDLDLLVEASAIDYASDVLRRRGYTDIQRTVRLDSRIEDHICDRPFVRDSDNSIVELHWALTPSARGYTIKNKELWERAQHLCIRDRRVPALGAEDTVIFLCLHGAKHGWSRLKWVCDLGFAFQAERRIDWHTVVSRSQQIGCYRVLLAGLMLASKLLERDMPEALRAPCPHHPAAQSVASRFQRCLASGSTIQGAEWMVCEVQSRDQAWDRFVLFWRTLSNKWRINEFDRKVYRVPKYLSALYYLIRPVRLMTKYGFGWIGALLRGR